MTLAANLDNRRPKIYQHGPDGYPTTAMAMAGVEHIPGRALILSLPDDVVQIHPDLIGELPFILDHYRRIGLHCANTIVADTACHVARFYPNHEMDVFLFSVAANAVYPNETRFAAAARLNDKNWFVTWCQTQGYSTPEVECYATGTVPDNTQLGYPLFVKAAVSGSGMHVRECASWAEVLEAVQDMPGDYQLQAAASHIASLNVLYFAKAGVAHHIITTDQILGGGTCHEGNRYPAAADPREVTDEAAQAAADLGIEGYFAFDVLVTPDGRFVFLECNPRPNGSTYYAVAAERLGADRPWTGRSFRTSCTSLGDFDLGDLQYSREHGYGVVIVGWGSILFGQLGLLIIGTAEEQSLLTAALTGLLS